jgi:hypothetical protein
MVKYFELPTKFFLFCLKILLNVNGCPLNCSFFEVGDDCPLNLCVQVSKWSRNRWLGKSSRITKVVGWAASIDRSSENHVTMAVFAPSIAFLSISSFGCEWQPWTVRTLILNPKVHSQFGVWCATGCFVSCAYVHAGFFYFYFCQGRKLWLWLCETDFFVFWVSILGFHENHAYFAFWLCLEKAWIRF